MNKLMLIKDLGYILPKPTSKQSRRYGLYLCKCGQEFKTQISDVKSGHTKSCGCLKKEATRMSRTTHGMSRHRLNNVYSNMIQRCYNSNHPFFSYYGGRNIVVCDEWLECKTEFFSWALSHGHKDNLSLDRINNDGNYEPDNCRWTTKAIQARNTRLITTNNKTGYKGVSFLKDGRYTASITVNYKQFILGNFKCRIKAAHVRDEYITLNNLEHTLNFG